MNKYSGGDESGVGARKKEAHMEGLSSLFGQIYKGYFMEIVKITHNHVAKSGKVRNGGAVHVEGKAIMGMGEGCGLGNCHCSDGYYISLFMPRVKGGLVEGIKVTFDDKKEMTKFLKDHEMISSG